MFFTNILLSVLILFFIFQLFWAIKEKRNNRNKLCLVSKKTGEVIELDATSFTDFINREIQTDFTTTAKMIFARVSEAFASGKLSDIKNYLNEKVLPIFQQAVTERENQHQKAEFALIGFKDVKIVEDTPTKKVVCFTTEQVNILRDSSGNIIEGDPLYVATVTENWTFVQKKENTWVVSGIESKEAHFA